MRSREDGRPCFSCFTHTRSRPRRWPRTSLACVTLLPRPDRTGKLIAKVKRNKGATPRRESDLDNHETLTERYTERWKDPACLGSRKRQLNRRTEREREREREGSDRSRPRGLEIGFLAASHSHQSVAECISTEILNRFDAFKP